jgi:hypothetical protein
MSLRTAPAVLFITVFAATAVPALGQDGAQVAPAARSGQVRVAGVVRDETNAIPLPGVPVEVIETKQTVYTDVDGRYTLQLPPGKHTLRVVLEGYQERQLSLDTEPGRPVNADVGLTMTRFAETVTVIAQAVDVQTSSAEAQLIERRSAPVIRSR